MIKDDECMNCGYCGTLICPGDACVILDDALDAYDSTFIDMDEGFLFCSKSCASHFA